MSGLVGKIGWALSALVTGLATLATVTGFTFRDCKDLWSPSSVKTINENERSDLRARLRSFASDGSVTADESRRLLEYASDLELDAKPSERYLQEIKPGIETSGRAVLEGLGFARRGHFSAARARYGRAAQLDPENATAWAGLGAAALDLGSAVEGEAALRKALALEPEDGEANYNLGVCLAAQKRSTAAFDYLERSLDLLLRNHAAPSFERQALLEDLERNRNLVSLRASPRFGALLQRVRDDLR
jgi:Flp pilus assembly protein TadD